MAQSAVNSLLGSLSSVLVGEAQLLIGVRGDVQFIRDEMESMKGFLQDLADVYRPNNQVRAWMRQVQDLADDSENCINRYLHTLGSWRPRTATSFLQRIPRLVQTIPARHRLASEIRELKARACEVGERRQRYGVMVPPRELSATRDDGEAADEEEDAWTLRALVDAADSLDKSALEVVSWLMSPGEYHPPRHSSQVDDFLRNIPGAMSKTEELAPGLAKILKGILGDDDDNIFDREAAIGFKRRHDIDLNQELRVPLALLRRLVLDSATAPAEGGDEVMPLMSRRRNRVQKPEGKAEEADQYGKKLVAWLGQALGDVISDPLLGYPKLPRILAIVTTPLDVRNPEDDEQMPGQMHTRATELARRVYHIAKDAMHFDFMAWVDAKLHCNPRQRLECLLQQVLLSEENLPQGLEDGMSRWSQQTDEHLREVISEHLRHRTFSIVLADHEDDAPWKEITQLLPPDFGPFYTDSAVIVTPLVQRTLQFHGWYIASWLLLSPRFKAHLHSNLDAARKKADELLVRNDGNEDLRGVVKEILEKCRWDPFSTKMVLHSLYANPHIRKVDLEKLLLGLKAFSPVKNARHTIRFCYHTLPNRYKVCLLYLSIFTKDAIIRRTRLVRRWAAENLVTRRQGLSALDEAEHGFKALITRGLVLPHQTDHQGKVKSCMVHPFVFSFITDMARNENVGNTALPPQVAHRFSIRNGIRLDQLSSIRVRQTAHSRNCWLLNKTPPPPTCSQDSSSHTEIPFLINLLSTTCQLGLVQVLDLENCNGLKTQHIKAICNKLFQLKYLSLRKTNVIELPKEIEKLEYLETLDIRQTSLRTVPAIIMLQKLVHLLAGSYIVGGENKDNSTSTIRAPHGIGNMTNIQTLSHVEVSDSVIKDDLVRLHQLRKLGVVLSSIGNNQPLLTLLIEAVGKLDECLSSLSIHIKQGEVEYSVDTKEAKSPPKTLESLNINGKIPLPRWIKDLHQLSKITLCHASLSGGDIRILGKLLNLRCIMLQYISCLNMLTLEEREFKKLELLVIESSAFSRIQFDMNAAPKLKKIVLTGQETDIIGIDDLATLREIEINGNYSTSLLRRIKNKLERNVNHPVLVHKPARVESASNTAHVE